ncbi:MAG TPA: DUF3592 domain-containing protein [Spirillospora sp.]|nr:DUF3592 domain-containing protein [Spirillospora sp.]
MSEPSSLSDAQFNRLARTVLHNPSASARKEALLELRQFDHPEVAGLLQQVIAGDKDAEVRDLAQNLLRKQTLADMIEQGSFDERADAPMDGDEADTRRDVPTLGELWAAGDVWVCRFCGAENTGGSVCASCGAERSARQVADASRKRKPKIEVIHGSYDDVFLLQPANKAFLLGKRRIISTFSGFGLGCGGLFMLPFLAVGIFVLVLAVIEWRNYHLLNTTGVVVQGTYTGRHQVVDDDDGDITYYADYEYLVNDTIYTGDHSVSRELYNRVEPGMRVDIRYVPSDPAISRIEGTNGIEEALFFTVFAAFWNLISWAIFAGMIVSFRRDRRLSRLGKLVRGELLNATSRRDSDGDYHVTVEYSFVPPDGGDVIFKKQSAQRNDLKNKPLPAKGSPVMVLYKDRRHFKML